MQGRVALRFAACGGRWVRHLSCDGTATSVQVSSGAMGGGTHGLQAGTGEHVQIPTQIHDAMIEHARFCYPEEACGLIALDDVGNLRMVYATTNVDRSRVRFTVAPREHFGAIRHAERNGWTIAGSFHSHPESAAFPSGRDIEGALDPEWLYFIVGLADTLPEVRAFRIRDYRVTEVEHREKP